MTSTNTTAAAAADEVNIGMTISPIDLPGYRITVATRKRKDGAIRFVGRTQHGSPVSFTVGAGKQVLVHPALTPSA